MAMNNREKVTTWLIEALPGSEIEASLLAEGFTRPGKSLVYLRRGAEIMQYFKLTFDAGPRYEPTALAHVLPGVILESAILAELVRQMTEGAPELAGWVEPSVVVGHQLQNLAPKDLHQQATRWFIHGEAETSGILQQIGAFAQRWAIPFLNEYRGIPSLIQGYEAGDERLRLGRHLYLAAAYLHVGEPAKGLEFLEGVFRRPAHRKQYAKAFEYLRRKGAS